MYFLFFFLGTRETCPHVAVFERESSGSNSCPLGLERTLLTCVHSLKFNEEVPLFKRSNKRVMHLTCVSLVVFVFFPPGLSAYRRGLAKDPDGQVSCHKPPWRHEDLAEVCQPLWKERTPGQYIDLIVKSPSVFSGLTWWRRFIWRNTFRGDWIRLVKQKGDSDPVKCNLQLQPWNVTYFNLLRVGADEVTQHPLSLFRIP